MYLPYIVYVTLIDITSPDDEHNTNNTPVSLSFFHHRSDRKQSASIFCNISYPFWDGWPLLSQVRSVSNSFPVQYCRISSEFALKRSTNFGYKPLYIPCVDSSSK